MALNESFSPQGNNRLQINAVNEEAAIEIEAILRRGLGLVRQLVLANMMGELQDEDPVLQEAMVAYVNRIADYIQAQFQPQVDGNRLVLDFGGGQADQLANVGSMGVLVGLAAAGGSVRS